MKNRKFSKKIHKVAPGKLFFYFDPIIILDVRRGYWFYRPETMRHEKIALKIKSIVMRITNSLPIIIQFSFLLHYF